MNISQIKEFLRRSKPQIVVTSDNRPMAAIDCNAMVPFVVTELTKIEQRFASFIPPPRSSPDE